MSEIHQVEKNMFLFYLIRLLIRINKMCIDSAYEVFPVYSSGPPTVYFSLMEWSL